MEKNISIQKKQEELTVNTNVMNNVEKEVDGYGLVQNEQRQISVKEKRSEKQRRKDYVEDNYEYFLNYNDFAIADDEDVHKLTNKNGKVLAKAIEELAELTGSIRAELREADENGKEEYKDLCNSFEKLAAFLSKDRLDELHMKGSLQEGDTYQLMYQYKETLGKACAYVSTRPAWKFKALSGKAKKRKNAAKKIRDSLSGGMLYTYISQEIVVMHDKEEEDVNFYKEAVKADNEAYEKEYGVVDNTAMFEDILFGVDSKMEQVNSMPMKTDKEIDKANKEENNRKQKAQVAVYKDYDNAISYSLNINNLDDKSAERHIRAFINEKKSAKAQVANRQLINTWVNMDEESMGQFSNQIYEYLATIPVSPSFYEKIYFEDPHMYYNISEVALGREFYTKAKCNLNIVQDETLVKIVEAKAAILAQITSVQTLRSDLNKINFKSEEEQQVKEKMFMDTIEASKERIKMAYEAYYDLKDSIVKNEELSKKYGRYFDEKLEAKEFELKPIKISAEKEASLEQNTEKIKIVADKEAEEKRVREETKNGIITALKREEDIYQKDKNEIVDRQKLKKTKKDQSAKMKKICNNKTVNEIDYRYREAKKCYKEYYDRYSKAIKDKMKEVGIEATTAKEGFLMSLLEFVRLDEKGNVNDKYKDSDKRNFDRIDRYLTGSEEERNVLIGEGISRIINMKADYPYDSPDDDSIDLVKTYVDANRADSFSTYVTLELESFIKANDIPQDYMTDIKSHATNLSNLHKYTIDNYASTRILDDKKTVEDIEHDKLNYIARKGTMIEKFEDFKEVAKDHDVYSEREVETIYGKKTITPWQEDIFRFKWRKEKFPNAYKDYVEKNKKLTADRYKKYEKEIMSGKDKRFGQFQHDIVIKSRYITYMNKEYQKYGKSIIADLIKQGKEDKLTSRRTEFGQSSGRPDYFFLLKPVETDGEGKLLPKSKQADEDNKALIRSILIKGENYDEERARIDYMINRYKENLVIMLKDKTFIEAMKDPNNFKDWTKLIYATYRDICIQNVKQYIPAEELTKAGITEDFMQYISDYTKSTVTMATYYSFYLKSQNVTTSEKKVPTNAVEYMNEAGMIRSIMHNEKQQWDDYVQKGGLCENDYNYFSNMAKTIKETEKYNNEEMEKATKEHRDPIFKPVDLKEKRDCGLFRSDENTTWDSIMAEYKEFAEETKKK